MNETIQIIFKVFKYVLKLQLDTLESEGAVLGDLHEQNITVMGGETREGPEGRVPGAEKLTFAVVDCSGTLPVINRPASELTRSKTLEGHLNCFLSFWAIPKYYPGLASGYACEVWKKMMSIGEDFNRGFRQEKWRAPELMNNLLKECERLEQKFKDGQQLSEQCRLMKAGGFTGGILEETTSAGGFSKLCAADRHPPLGPTFCRKRQSARTCRKRQSARTCGKRQSATSSSRDSSQESAEAKSASQTC